MTLAVIILTFNEAKHLLRAIASVAGLYDDLVVVDSFSTDETATIALGAGARLFKRKFKHQADQLIWALENTQIRSDWVMRLDADEIIHHDLGDKIRQFLPNAPSRISGLILQRRHIWMGRWVRFGGRYPLNLVRIWRLGSATIEYRWMDEHISIREGETVILRGGFSDYNLNDIGYFIDKHNRYATREAIDVLAARYNLLVRPPKLSIRESSFQAALKRRIKEQIYNRLPFWLSPALYFGWRYFIQLGFLDGKTGLIYHFLQGFWYRFLVGSKLVEWDMQLRPLKSRQDRILKLQQLTGHTFIEAGGT